MLHTIIGKSIETAVQLLSAGKLVAIPTETVYGLAANALDDKAVVKIFEAKNRPAFNPLILHVASWELVARYVETIPAKANLLAAAFSPGPITFLLPKKSIVPDLVTAGSDLVAIRVPAHPLTLELLQQLDFPLAAPSANPFGYVSPTTAQHVMDGLAGKIDYVLDGGSADVGLESTIIGFDEQENVLLYRSGGIGVEAIESVLGEKVLPARLSPLHHPSTSGQLKSHYATETALYIGDIDQLKQQFAGKSIASISFLHQPDGIEHPFVLSPTGNLSEAARNLFAIMRSIDQLQVDVILAETFPSEGIGRAINDRLFRAQADQKD